MPRPSPIHFRFGNDSQSCLGTMTISILISDAYIIRQMVDIVKANVPFLIRLDLLDKYYMFIDSEKTCSDRLSLDYTCPPTQAGSHLSGIGPFLENALHQS